MNKIKQRNSLAIVFLIIVLLLLKPWVQVGVGEKGIVLNFGAVQDRLLDEGIHFKIPFVQQVILMDTKTQKVLTKVTAFSSDLKGIKLSIILNYHILPSKVNIVYQTIGVEFKEIIIKPTVQEVIKAVSARYSAIELITKRPAVIQEIHVALNKRLLASNILVDSISIISFSFSKPFTDTLKITPTAREIVLTNAERDLRRIKTEVKQEFLIQLKNREYGTHKR